jgi:Tol biopolymer transport system component
MDLWSQRVAEDGGPAGEPLAVTQGLGIRSAAFSPDGARLAYSRGGRVSNVWRVPVLSDRPATWADAEQVTSEHAFIEFVDLSPDGALLAVSSNRRGNQDLWLLPAAGGEMTPLTTEPTPDWNPRWSPDGHEIAFYAYRSGNRDIWVIPSRGGPARQLSSHPGQDWYPSWSPDGHEIAFHSRGTAATLIVGVRGGEPRPLAAAGGAIAEWSPDGQWFVIQRQNRLYRVAKDGGEPVLLPPTGARPFSPRFSRDGRSIYYSVITGPRENHDIWKLLLDEGNVTRLTKLEGRPGNIGEVFSTDGRYLYFTWREDDGDIWVMDVVKDVSE